MKQLKMIVLCTALLSMVFMFSACGNDKNTDDNNNMKTEDVDHASPSPEAKATDEARSTEDRRNTEDPDSNGNDDNTAGEVIDDVGNTVEEGVDDVIDGVEDLGDDLTGNGVGDGTVTPAPTNR